MGKIKISELISRIFVLILAVILIVTLPLLAINQDDDLSHIYSVFIGSKSQYQGIIEVWNIDTFESGTSAKSNYIESVAKDFQKQSKGIYVIVRNLTEFECCNLLERGEKPDIFSCSYGVACEIKNYIKEFSTLENLDVLSNFLNAGKVAEKLYGLAWCFGYYTLISSEKHIKNAGVNFEEIKLSDVALSLGYIKENKNSKKSIYSLVYGAKKYLMPKHALSSYNNSGLNLSSDLAIDINSKNNSQYTAYTSFLSGNSTILLGTQRDYYKIENRVKNGKISNVIYEPLTAFTDLIQFSFLAKSDSDLRSKYAEIFACMLSSKNSQKKLKSVGLLPVTGDTSIYEDSHENKIIESFSKCQTFNNIFISKSEINDLQ